MANASNWGGKRIGAGRKPKPLAEKINEGKTAMAMPVPEPPDIEAADMPEVRDYLSDDQRMGELHGKEIYEEMYMFIARHGCTDIVSPLLIEQFSMAMARYIQIEKISSEYGFVSKHPTTGAMIGSPFVSMAQAYLKLANTFYQEIFSILLENSREPVTGNPQDDMMEKLLGM